MARPAALLLRGRRDCPARYPPFFLFDRRDAVYSLVTWRGGSPIGGNSIWSASSTLTSADLPPRYALDHLVRRLDTPTIFVFIALFVFLAVRRLRASPYGPEAWAIVTVGAIALPLLTKRNWPYYYLEPFIFLLIGNSPPCTTAAPGCGAGPC